MGGFIFGRHRTVTSAIPISESSNVGVLMGFGYTGCIGHTGGDPGVVTLLFFDPKSVSVGS